MSSDPAAVLAASLPENVWAAFPAGVRGLLERHVALEGELEVAIEDGRGYSRLHHALLTGGGRLQLRFADAPSTTLQTGDRAQVNGVLLGDEVALASAGISAAGEARVDAAASILPNTFGPQKTLVMLVNFQDNTTQPFTAGDAQSAVFTTASNFFLENSFQQTWLTGDVAGWYTLPISSSPCNYSSIQTYAQQAARNDGYNLSNYSRFLYIFPQIASCGWDGYSTIGGNPSSSWNNGTLAQGIVCHELGHALGLYHSHSLNCGAVVYAASGCTQYEYGDYYDTMANSNVNGYSMDFNAFQRERLGWLNYSVQPPISTISSSGSYNIAPSETQDTNSKALKLVQSASNAYYYVEFRQALGFDNYLSLPVPGYPSVLNGVVVHSAIPANANSSNLLNMNPSSSWGTAMALDVGQSYTDSTAGVTIATTAVSGTAATVQVTFGSGTCTPANPTVSISPAQSPGMAAGTMVTFTVAVTDNDSSACGNASFNLAANVPGAWTSALGSSTMNLSPGGSASTALQVTSPPTAVAGSYTVSGSATNAAAASYTAAGSATYVVSAPVCTRVNPAVTISPAQSPGVAAGTTVTFTVAVTDNDNSACGNASFNLAANVPGGWTSALGSSTLNLSPGSSGSTTLQVTSPQSAAAGSYMMTANATNAAAPSYTAAGSATYVVSPPVCTRVIPAVTISPAQGPAAAAGSTVTFTVSVTDNDNSACGNASFNLAANVPGGWTSALGSSTMSLSPGSSGSTTLQVTSPSTVVAGSYMVSANATNAAAPSYTGTASATYVVSAPVCTRVNPAITISPAQDPAVAAGSTVTFTVSVTNNDNSACGNASFNLAANVPGGWTSALGSSTMSLSPGGSGSTALQVTSPPNAAAGSYTVSGSATNAAAASYAAAGSAIYMVSAPVCTRANPSVTASPSQSPAVPAGTAVPFTVTVTNNDAAGCTASSFSLAASVPKRWNGSFTSSTLSLGPGTTGSATLLVASLPSAAAGSYSIRASATNAAATSYTGSASATYLIAAPVLQTPVMTVSTDQSSYSSGQTVTLTVALLLGGSPYTGAAVSANITKPNGSGAGLSGTTGSNGVAVLKYNLKKQDPAGTWQVQVSTPATASSTSAAAGTTFVVQ